MKKLLLMFTAMAFLFVACEKDNLDVPLDHQETTIEFKIDQTNFDTKNTVPMCDDDAIWDHVVFTIKDGDGIVTSYTSTINYIGVEYLTQVIKLDPGTYWLTSFLVYDDEGNIIRAAPMDGSMYYDLMTYQLDLEFTVEAFMKKQVAIDVLCYEDLVYDDFGFTWFEFNDVRIERQCFFGDICAQSLEDFEGTMYDPIQFDMPALFQIEIFKMVDNTPVLLRTFNNYDIVGDCMEVYWPNRLAEEEEFHFVLSVQTPNGLEEIHTWIFLDDNCPAPGEDGVVEFVVGDCNLDPTDFQFDGYIIDIDVLIIHADEGGYVNDIVTKLTAFGEFNSVDVYDARNTPPTLADLVEYETVLVYNNSYNYPNVALGDVLADYSDTGGGVTLMVFSWYNTARLEGRYMTEEYGSIPFGDYNPYSPGSLGTVHNPAHPIMDGVTSFSTNNFRSGYTGPLSSGGELIAEYQDGMVLAAVKDHGTSRTCDLGFFPPSSDVHSGSWNVNTHGDVLMLNCLMWTAGASN